MTDKYESYNALLEDLCCGRSNVRSLAEKYDKHPNYVRSMKKKVDSLKYEPRIFDGKLSCYRCGRSDKDFHLHHSHKTGEWIAILCRDCNYVVEDVEHFTPLKDRTKYDWSYIRKLERELVKIKGKKALVDIGKYMEQSISDLKSMLRG